MAPNAPPEANAQIGPDKIRIQGLCQSICILFIVGILKDRVEASFEGQSWTTCHDPMGGRPIEKDHAAGCPQCNKLLRLRCLEGAAMSPLIPTLV